MPPVQLRQLSKTSNKNRMADTDNQPVKIPLFDGKSKNFVMWWITFKAYAKVQMFSYNSRS
jgi:hypothetical protein